VTDVSVVIPCRDAAGTLGEQLSALAAQRFAGSWEVIVADNGSTDSSRAAAEAHAPALPSLTVVAAGGRRGPGHARNAGAAAARGAKLLFCDADDVVADGWLAAMARALDEHGLVASRFDFARLNPGWTTRRRSHPQEHGLNPYDYPDFLPHAGAGGLGVRREVHEAVGGFDETLPMLEDTDYCWRVQLQGVPLVFAPDAVVHVRDPRRLRGLFLQRYRLGRYNVLIYRRYRTRGMPRLEVAESLRRWAGLVLRTPLLFSRHGWSAWIGALGWRLGRLDGCLRYRTLAL
jgi:GT2 family glycosyltransferase